MHIKRNGGCRSAPNARHIYVISDIICYVDIFGNREEFLNAQVYRGMWSCNPNWTTVPVNGSKYRIVEQYILYTDPDGIDNATIPTVKGQPTHCLYGDADYGEFIHPVPYDTTAIRLKMRYYADLKTRCGKYRWLHFIKYETCLSRVYITRFAGYKR